MRMRLAAGLLVFTRLAVSDTHWPPAPDFTLPGLDNTVIVSLSDYRGAFVLVDFWASWCPPCRQSLPEYQVIRDEIHAKYGTETFEILAINVDIHAQEGLAFLRDKRITYPVLREDTGRIQRQYQLNAMPTAYLIDPEGRLVFEYSGFSDQHAALLSKHLHELLDARATENAAESL